MKNISITRKLNYLQNRLNNPSTIISKMVNRLSDYLHKTDLNSFFHTISLMEVEKKKTVTKVLKEFKKEEVLATPTEEKFLNYILENTNIDLTEEEKEIFIKKVMEKIIIPLHDRYLGIFKNKSYNFS